MQIIKILLVLVLIISIKISGQQWQSFKNDVFSFRASHEPLDLSKNNNDTLKISISAAHDLTNVNIDVLVMDSLSEARYKNLYDEYYNSYLKNDTIEINIAISKIYETEFNCGNILVITRAADNNVSFKSIPFHNGIQISNLKDYRFIVQQRSLNKDQQIVSHDEINKDTDRLWISFNDENQTEAQDTLKWIKIECTNINDNAFKGLFDFTISNMSSEYTIMPKGEGMSLIFSEGEYVGIFSKKKNERKEQLHRNYEAYRIFAPHGYIIFQKAFIEEFLKMNIQELKLLITSNSGAKHEIAFYTRKTF